MSEEWSKFWKQLGRLYATFSSKTYLLKSAVCFTSRLLKKNYKIFHNYAIKWLNFSINNLTNISLKIW